MKLLIFFLATVSTLFLIFVCFGKREWVTKILALATFRSEKMAKEFSLGVSKDGTKFYLTEQNLGHHIQFIAPSGGGKTNFIKGLMEDRIGRGKGLIFVDYKGDFELARWLYSAAAKNHREDDFRLVSLADPGLSVPYNPIKPGSAQQIESQLMNSMTWSEEHYRKLAEDTLLILTRALCEHRDTTGELFHLGHIHELLRNQSALSFFADRIEKSRLPSAHDLSGLRDRLEKPAEREKILGLTVSLSLVVNSATGPLLTRDVEKGSFTLREAIEKRRVTYFLVNSLMLRESAKVFGRLLLQDFMCFLGNRYAAPGQSGDSNRPRE